MHEFGLSVLKATDHRVLISSAFAFLLTWSVFYRWKAREWPPYALAVQFGGVILSAYSLLGMTALMLTRPLACEALSPESVLVLWISSFLGLGYSIKQQILPCLPPQATSVEAAESLESKTPEN